MKSLEEIKEILVKQKPILRAKYGVKTLGFFGSFLKEGQKKRTIWMSWLR